MSKYLPANELTGQVRRLLRAVAYSKMAALVSMLFVKRDVPVVFLCAFLVWLYGHTLSYDHKGFRVAIVIFLLISVFFRATSDLEFKKTGKSFFPDLADEIARLLIIFPATVAAAMFCLGGAVLPLTMWLFWFFAACLSYSAVLGLQNFLRPFITASPRENIVIICAGEQGQRLAERLRKNDSRVKVMSFFEDRQSRYDLTTLQAPYLGGTGSVIDYCRNNKVDKIVVALPGFAEGRLAQIVEILNVLPVPVYLNPDMAVLSGPATVFGDVGQIKMFQLSGTPVKGWRAGVKRLEDIIVALTAIVIFSPAFIIVPILIKMEDPGPVFFRQKRYGYNNKLFDCLKFRSMYIQHCHQAEIKLTEHGDPRVMKIGDFIRRTSIDEIPQFLNVLMGDMSVVGPRPHPPGVKAGERVYEEVVDKFSGRYCVKPGLTGWAQVNGLRGNTFTEDHIRQRFEHDMYYVQNWSLWLDLVIIVRTFFVGFGGKNAF